jgi:hypothetical protein
VRQVVNVENAELLSGDGTTGHLTGLLNTSGILTHAVGTDTPLDAVEISIAAAHRHEPCRGESVCGAPEHMVRAAPRERHAGALHRGPDPTNAAGSQLWGVEVLPTTQITADAGALLDTRKLGYAVVREAITFRTGTNDDDFTQQHREVREERLALVVQRSSAVMKLTGLPTS